MQLSDYISNDTRNLFTMVDHFTKFGWTILMKNKGRYYFECFQTMIDILFKLKNYTQMMVESLEIKGWILFKENNIDHITGGSYNPQH